MCAAGTGQLAVSVVSYHSDPVLLEQTVRSLAQAVRTAVAEGLIAAAELDVLDNAAPRGEESQVAELIERLRAEGLFARVDLISGQGNVGYGVGHNLAQHQATAELCLVLNPDVRLEADTLVAGLRFLAAHPQVGLIAPRVSGADGRRQFLCKRYPTILDLLLRGFAPVFVRRWFDARLARYELRDVTVDADAYDIPIVSGCFMLLRRELWRALGGFDPRFFVYFEDFDLSLRAGAITRLAYVPSMRITHYGGGAARKGWRHTGLFLRSAIRFFNKHGWKLW